MSEMDGWTMGQSKPIKDARFARHVTSTVTLSLMRVVARTRYGGDMGRHFETILLGMAIYARQHEGRPMTAARLARYVGMPRNTLMRKLALMQKLGVVRFRPEDRTYIMDEEWLDRPEAIAMTREAVQIVISACRRLESGDLDDLRHEGHTPPRPEM
jgi:hypothetical protein